MNKFKIPFTKAAQPHILISSDELLRNRYMNAISSNAHLRNARLELTTLLISKQYLTPNELQTQAQFKAMRRDKSVALQIMQIRELMVDSGVVVRDGSSAYLDLDRDEYGGEFKQQEEHVIVGASVRTYRPFPSKQSGFQRLKSIFF